MSDAQRYLTDKLEPIELANGGPAAPAWRQAVVVLASDYDALAQRCRELEACIAGDHTNLVALLRVGQAQAERERDSLRGEVEQLRKDAERWNKCQAMPKAWWLEAMAAASRPRCHGGRSLNESIDAAMRNEQ